MEKVIADVVAFVAFVASVLINIMALPVNALGPILIWQSQSSSRCNSISPVG